MIGGGVSCCAASATQHLRHGEGEMLRCVQNDRGGGVAGPVEDFPVSLGALPGAPTKKQKRRHPVPPSEKPPDVNRSYFC